DANGQASTTDSALTVGSHTISAIYTPTSTFVGSQGSTTQTVNAATSTGLVSGTNPSVYGQMVTFTATVTNMTNTDTPTGSVEFFDDTTSTDLGTGTALSGTGASASSTFSISTLA